MERIELAAEEQPSLETMETQETKLKDLADLELAKAVADHHC